MCISVRIRSCHFVFIPVLAEVSPDNNPYPTSKQTASSLVPCMIEQHFVWRRDIS